MRRTALGLATVLAVIGIAVAGCGGEEEATPTPETVTGSVETSTTEATTTTTESTSTGETETEGTTTTTTTTTAGGGGGGQGNPTAGKAVFTGSAGCTNCHTLADAGSTGTVGPNLDDAKPPYDLVVDRVTNGKGVMPPFKGQLTPTQIQDVAAYVSSVAGQ